MGVDQYDAAQFWMPLFTYIQIPNIVYTDSLVPENLFSMVPPGTGPFCHGLHGEPGY